MPAARVLLLRMSVTIAAAWGVALLPSPDAAMPLTVKNAIAAGAAVVICGKLLYDTLFAARMKS